MAVTRRRDAGRAYPYPDEYERYPRRDRRGAPRHDDYWRDADRRAVPPVIVVTPGQAAPQQIGPWASPQGNWNAWDAGVPSHSQRQFRVMGYDESEDDG